MGNRLLVGIIGTKLKKVCFGNFLFSYEIAQLGSLISEVGNINYPTDWVRAMNQWVNPKMGIEAIDLPLEMSDKKTFLIKYCDDPLTDGAKPIDLRLEISDKKTFLIEHCDVWFETDRGDAEGRIRERVKEKVSRMNPIEIDIAIATSFGNIPHENYSFLLLDFTRKVVYTNLLDFSPWTETEELLDNFENIQQFPTSYEAIINLGEAGFKIFNVNINSHYGSDVFQFIQDLQAEETIFTHFNKHSEAYKTIMSWPNKTGISDPTDQSDDAEEAYQFFLHHLLEKIIFAAIIMKLEFAPLLSRETNDLIDKLLDKYDGHFHKFMETAIEQTVLPLQEPSVVDRYKEKLNIQDKAIQKKGSG